MFLNKSLITEEDLLFILIIEEDLLFIIISEEDFLGIYGYQGMVII